MTRNPVAFHYGVSFEAPQRCFPGHEIVFL